MSKIQVFAQQRKGSILTPSQLPCLSKTATVNLTSGCAHGCLYCYSRSYSQYPGEGKVVVYGNTLDKMREELRRRRIKPPFVYFSPSTDVFQPVEEVLCLAYEVFSFLLQQNIGIAFVTKGAIPREHMALFEAKPELVRAQVGLITLDATLLRVLEPGCASVETRLRQIESLITAGIKTEVRLDPILPGLTDDELTLRDLFMKLARIAVTHVALNMLYLRPVLFKTLRQGLLDTKMSGQLLQRFVPGLNMRVCDGRFSQTALPRMEREEIFQRAVQIAKAEGISCHCCGCMNPDITSENCNLTGDWGSATATMGQMGLL